MRMSELRDLARLYSIETGYVDAAGKKQTASRDTLVALIEQRSGLPLAEARERRDEQKFIEPVIVVWGTGRPKVKIAASPQTILEWDIELEDGSWRAGRGESSGGVLTLDVRLPFGYHALFVNGRRALLIAAPLQAEAPKQKSWGIFAPLYAAHTRRSWGAGDLGDLLAYAAWISEYGGTVVATLPMLAAFDNEPSPYSPVSRLFWNEMYLDVTRLPELEAGDVDEGAVASLRQNREIDYEGVRREKRRLLEKCVERFDADEPYERFAARAREYAEFRAAAENPQDDADRERRIRYHLYVQYRMAGQMRQVAGFTRREAVSLYLDFPLGVDPAGYDAWRYGEVFASGVSVGAPPDPFFTKGQNWGFAPFDPDAVRREGYRYFREAIRHHASHAGILRLDHVMGLHRLYWIPEGSDARSGAYVNYRAEELYAILTLESRRHGCAIVGEDLGTVPPVVPRMMRRHGLRRMFVVQYEVKADQQPPLESPAPASVASLNTHDMPPFASFWSGRDIDDRLEQDLLDERSAAEERLSRERVRRSLTEFLREHGHQEGASQESGRVLESLLAFLASSDAETVLINLEDLWGEIEPQNVPGVPERSWRHKFRMGLEEMRRAGNVRRVLASMQTLRARGLLPEELQSTVPSPRQPAKEG
jgi:4-alpha-glucanotransferase